MRKVTINKTEIEVRGLTGPEIEQLKKEDLPMRRMGPDHFKMYNDPDLSEKTVERVFDMVLPEADKKLVKEGPNNKYVETWKAILDETYGNPAEAKNS